MATTMETTNDPAVFWAEYEKRLGEKVLAHSLGRYLAGWEDFTAPLWGLLIATDAGFRFHHFAHEGWIQALSRLSGGGGAAPEERTFFIPIARIRKVELRIERSWWRRLLVASPPTVAVRYEREGGSEAVLLAETDKTAEGVVSALVELLD
jgi:hypothetical protein